jgi:Acyltransferase
MANVFTTPLLTPMLRGVARAGLSLSGWQIALGDAPKPPFVCIGAPHTSNWDFMLMLAAILEQGLDARWLGKHTLFRFPFGSLMRWLGGIPVDRSAPHNLVAQVVQDLKSHPQLVLCLAPEGTRKKVTRWKTGFYHIARETQLPIVLAGIDVGNRQVCCLGVRHTQGDPEREILEIQRRYRGLDGFIPENAFQLDEGNEQESGH